MNCSSNYSGSYSKDSKTLSSVIINKNLNSCRKKKKSLQPESNDRFSLYQSLSKKNQMVSKLNNVICSLSKVKPPQTTKKTKDKNFSLFK